MNLSARRSSSFTTGAILIASGRVPKTESTFIAYRPCLAAGHRSGPKMPNRSELDRTERVCYHRLHRPWPDCLVLAFINLDEPIHAVIAVNQPSDYILVVTVYRPTAEEWENDWRIRK